MTRPRAKELGFGALWVALAILAAVAAFTYRSIDATAETLAWSTTTHLRLEKVEEVSSAYARAAAARRAYIVSGDASQLDAVPDLDARTDRAIASLRASMAGTEFQAENVDLLGGLIHQRLTTLDAALAERRRTGSSAETAEGLAETARIRAVRESIEREENAQLTARDARTRREVRAAKVTEVAGTGVSFAILLLVFGRLREEVVRRSNSERALQESEAFLDSIVENIPHMIVVKDARNLEVKRINRAAEALLGRSRQELVGKTAHAFGVGEPLAVASQVGDRASIDGNVIVEVEARLVRVKGGERWIRTKRVPVLDEEGGQRYVLSISDDVTEERAAALILQAARDAAEAANKELESFSYSVAHDLRAPLRAIDGFSQALEEDCAAALDDEGRGFLNRIRAASLQMAQLIDGLLGLARVSRGTLEREPVDLTRMVRQLAVRQREAQPERALECVIAEGARASCDPRLLGAALENLLGNAWKFTRHVASPRVEFGVTTEAGETVYFVKDNGAGFDPAYAPKLFGAFQRLHSVAEFEGSGIGLANVQRIVQRHGGRVWAEGAVGQGATFYFTLGGSKVAS